MRSPANTVAGKSIARIVNDTSALFMVSFCELIDWVAINEVR